MGSGRTGRDVRMVDAGGRWCWTSSRARLSVMVAVAAAVGALAGLLGAWTYAPLAAWAAAAATFVGWTWAAAIVPMSPSQTAAHATREDPGNAATDLIVLIASVASLAAVGLVLIRASSASGPAQSWLAAMAVGTVALSWFAVHTLFTLRYAKLYYAGAQGGVNFNQTIPPRYLDFAYLAFTIGMTFQVSDTDLESPAIRATALRQALLAYLFGAVILATTINFVAGLGA